MINSIVTNLTNKNLLKLSFVFTFLFASVTIFQSNANTLICSNNIVIGNETMKMSVTPSEKGADQANVELYAASNEATIIVFDQNGMVVLEEIFPVKKDQKNNIKLNFGDFKSGTYYIIHNENKDAVTYSLINDEP